MSATWTPKIIFCGLIIPFLFSACSHLDFSEVSEHSLSIFLDSGNFFYAILVSYGAGFLTSLSPCVYPLIPITLSVIGARRYESALQGFIISFVYVSGMIALYVGLGIFFSSLGILFGGVFQNPWILILIAALFLFFALSLFGASNWLLPDRLLRKLTHVGGSGYRGAFFMGLVSGLIASPCTGPVLAFILTLISKNGDLASGSLLMLSFGLGIGTPFLILGAFSSLIGRIPKSGVWMNRVKAVMAILMVATSLYYLSLGVSGFLEPRTDSSQQGWLTIARSEDAYATLEKAIIGAKEESKPVIIDFYADWCKACHELEEFTFRDQKVASALNSFKLIRVDLTTLNQQLDKIQEVYGVVGLPLIVFYDKNGKLHSKRIFGFVGPKEFLEIIDPVKK